MDLFFNFEFFFYLNKNYTFYFFTDLFSVLIKSHMNFSFFYFLCSSYYDYFLNFISLIDVYNNNYYEYYKYTDQYYKIFLKGIPIGGMKNYSIAFDMVTSNIMDPTFELLSRHNFNDFDYQNFEKFTAYYVDKNPLSTFFDKKNTVLSKNSIFFNNEQFKIIVHLFQNNIDRSYQINLYVKNLFKYQSHLIEFINDYSYLKKNTDNLLFTSNFNNETFDRISVFILDYCKNLKIGTAYLKQLAFLNKIDNSNLYNTTEIIRNLQNLICNMDFCNIIIANKFSVPKTLYEVDLSNFSKKISLYIQLVNSFNQNVSILSDYKSTFDSFFSVGFSELNFLESEEFSKVYNSFLQNYLTNSQFKQAFIDNYPNFFKTINIKFSNFDFADVKFNEYQFSSEFKDLLINAKINKKELYEFMIKYDSSFKNYFKK